MALRLLQDHLRDIKKGICAPGHFYLTSQGLDAFFFGQKRNVNRRQWRDFGARRAVAPVLALAFAVKSCRPSVFPAPPSIASTWPLTLARPWPAASFTWAAASGPSAARTGSSALHWPASTAGVPAPLGAVLPAAFIFCIFGGRRFLRPGGEKKFFQI
jgi:hypothetical protein